MAPNPFFRFIATIAYPFLKLLDWITPLAALIARCWVGYVFLKSGLLKLDHWQSTVMLFTYEFHVPLIPGEIAAVIGTATEIILPIFVALGLGSRLMVALLFLFNLVAAISYPHLWTSDGLDGLLQHANWGVMLLLLMCFGTGKWSLDPLLLMLFNKKANNMEKDSDSTGKN